MQHDDGINENDFVIRIRPSEINNEWTGQIDISIITSMENTLDDESYSQLLHLTKMVCSTVPIMEQDQDLSNYISDWVIENIEGEKVEDEKTVDITHEDGNVVRLNFNTPTKGQA